jgi:hypothetical protein
MRTYDFGDRATGLVADENDWTKTGPRMIHPLTRKWGTVTGIFTNSRNAVTIQTASGETYCIRVDV